MPNPAFVHSFKLDSSLLPSGKGVRVILKSGQVLLMRLSRGTMRPLTAAPSKERPDGVLQLKKGEWIDSFHNTPGSDVIILLALSRRSSRLLALDAKSGRTKWSKKLTSPRELTTPWRTQGKRTQMPMASFLMTLGGDAPIQDPRRFEIRLLTLDSMCVIAWQCSGTQTAVLRGGEVIQPPAFGCRCVLRAIDIATGGSQWQTTLEDALIDDIVENYVQRLDGVWRIDSVSGELSMIVPLNRQSLHMHVSKKELLVLCPRGKDLILLVHRNSPTAERTREIELRVAGRHPKILSVGSRILVTSQGKRTHIVNTKSGEVVTIEVPSYWCSVVCCSDSIFMPGNRGLLGFSAVTGKPLVGMEAISEAGGYRRWIPIDAGLPDAFLADSAGGRIKVSQDGEILAKFTQERDDIGHVLFADRGRVAVADWTAEPGRPPIGYVDV